MLNFETSPFSYQSLEELAKFAQNREEKGVERILPVRIDCADGIVVRIYNFLASNMSIILLVHRN